MFPETFQGRVDADAPFRAERSLTGSHTMNSETLPGWRLLQENIIAMTHADCPALLVSILPRLRS